MIADSLSNWRLYRLGPVFETAFKFVEGLDCSSRLGEYLIDGRDVYSSIAEYETSSTAPDFFEVHRTYIDLQITLSGRETLGWLPKAGLQVKTPYDQARDCEFLQPPKLSFSRVEINPGSFAVFFPDDAHVGKLAVAEGPELIRKVVVKIKASLLGKG